MVKGQFHSAQDSILEESCAPSLTNWTHWGRHTMVAIFRRHSQMHFTEWKCIHFGWHFIGVSSNGPMATSHYLNQWWKVYWRICGSLGLNELTLITAWDYEVITSIIACGMKSIIHSQTSTMQPLKFGNVWVISTNKVLCVWLLVHDGTKGSLLPSIIAGNHIAVGNVMRDFVAVSSNHPWSIVVRHVQLCSKFRQKLICRHENNSY